MSILDVVNYRNRLDASTPLKELQVCKNQRDECQNLLDQAVNFICSSLCVFLITTCLGPIISKLGVGEIILDKDSTHKYF